MTVKATWLWNGSAADGQLLYGFSETWYSDLAPAALRTAMFNCAKDRVKSMAAGTVLYGYRIGQPAGKSFTGLESSQIVPPGANSTPNIPQDAALCQVFGTAAGNPIKRFFMHDLPDSFVANAQFTNLPLMADLAADWVDALLGFGFKFRYSILGVSARIASIDANGHVTTSDNIVVAGGNDIKLVRVRDVTGRPVKGIFRVAAAPAPTATTFTLLNWPGNIVGPSGSVRVVTYGYSALQAPDHKPNRQFSALVKPGSRKCGRPFGQLRGRVSARR